MDCTRSQRRFVESLLKFVDNCSLILDAGCGSGWLGEKLKEHLSATVVAVDVEKENEKSGVEHFAVMDVTSLGFSESFDLVIAKDILEHIANPMSAMKEFARILKKEGKIIITVPSPEAPFLWDDYTHVRPFTKASLCKLMVKSGFDVVLLRYLAAPTPGAALLRMEGFLNSLADKGFRKGNVLAVGIKRTKTTKQLS
jgi:SAM-dependent methyltransferase